MKTAIALAAFCLLTVPAFAAEPAAPAAPTQAPAKVDLTANDLNILIVSLVNSGTACDAGVAIYCQVVGVRASLVQRLQAELVKIEQPGAKK